MNHRQLTERGPAAKTAPMQGTCERHDRSGRHRLAVMGLVGLMTTLGGCVSVNAPDKPIVIELNINITQDVAVRLEQDAEKAMDQHKDVF